jgi:tricarballylate dehydrogenase
MPDYDVIVVGAGNAALAASVSAREAGASRVLVLEKAPEAERGGNTHFSGGLLRFAFDQVEDLARLVPHAERDYPGFTAGVEPYPAAAFRGDLHRVTGGRTDPELSEILIGNSYETVCWMSETGRVPMEPALSLGGVRVGNVIKWPKGAIIRAEHEGVGLSATWFATAEERGVEIRYETGAVRLVQDRRGRVTGVVVKGPEGIEEISARAVVLGCGGFEANQAWRAQYLGSPWDHAKVRGSRYNQGDGLRMAIEAGALQWGQWSGCHATPINAEAPPFGVRELTDKTNRLSYPYGVMLNTEGRRWIDEAPDFQFFTYARYGGLILRQPKGFVYQIFDGKVLHLLEGRYSTSEPYRSDTLEGLVRQLDMPFAAAMETLEAYNAAAGRGEFNPGVLDGMRTEGIDPPKSNWAQKLDTPPFVAYPATGGITFSFGGLKIDGEARVIGTDWKPIPGLYCCGEMVGNLFHDNYPGGTGLMSGAVFGRIAGRSAAGA